MKISTSSKKEPNSKVKKIEEKHLLAKEEISYLKKLNREKRKKAKVLKVSRDNWKEKKLSGKVI